MVLLQYIYTISHKTFDNNVITRANLVPEARIDVLKFFNKCSSLGVSVIQLLSLIQ